MTGLRVLVPLAAAGLTLPAVAVRGSARLPQRVAAGSVAGEQHGYVWHPWHLAAAPLMAWMVAGPILALLLGVLVAVLHSQVRGWNHRAAARRIDADLPAVLHNVARRLRAGDPPGLAFAEALRATRGAVRGSYAAAMLMRGEPLAEAIDRWHREVSRAVPSNVLDDLLHVVAVSDRVGGLRASAVEAVADLASERRALAQETAAQASQAKASATVMTIAPLVFSAQMVLRDPVASRLLLHTPVGWLLISTGMSFDLAAWLWIRRASVGRGVRARTSATAGGRRHAALLACRSGLVRRVAAQRLPERRLLGPAGPAPVRGVSSTVPVLERVGTALERRVAVIRTRLEAVGLLPRGWWRTTTWSTEHRRRMGLATIVMPPLILLRPLLGALAVIVVVVGPKLHARITNQRLFRERTAAVAHTIELIRSALECGTTPSVALLVVADVDASALGPALRVAAADLRQGSPFDDVVRRLVVSAPELRAMADVLLASSRLGLPVVETLRGLAVEARDSRRREAEARARRLPVLLLFPVVCLTLPAFVLLTVAPLLLSGLGALHI